VPRSPSRGGLRVRPATPRDLPALVDLAVELREALVPTQEAGLRPATPAGRALLEQRMREALEAADRELVLVVDDADVPLGMALFTVTSANALVDLPALHMSHAVVGGGNRRRGAGRALVAAAAACAEERGLDQVVVSVQAGSREANRFFARLGFAPLAMRRSTSVPALRRRLAQESVGMAALPGAGGLPGVRRRPRRPSVPAQATAPVAAPLPAEPEARP
jgi:ribosomal protein S18 acetylase RimI-like enzyme